MRKKAKFKKKQRFLADFEESLREIKLYNEGKIKLKTIQQVLEELPDPRRKNILSSYRAAKEDEKSGKLKFSSDANELMNSL